MRKRQVKLGTRQVSQPRLEASRRAKPTRTYSHSKHTLRAPGRTLAQRKANSR